MQERIRDASQQQTSCNLQPPAPCHFFFSLRACCASSSLAQNTHKCNLPYQIQLFDAVKYESISIMERNRYLDLLLEATYALHTARPKSQNKGYNYKVRLRKVINLYFCKDRSVALVASLYLYHILY